MSTPTVSVVIPCYNAAGTIAETLDSALAQSVELEIIVIDDGSKDTSRQVLESYGERITAVFGPNRGAGEARNTGIGLARGQWIQFLDADDLLCPGTLARRLEVGADSDVVICDWREFSQVDGAVVEGSLRAIDVAALQHDPELAIAVSVWAPPAAVLYRRAIVDSIGGFRADLPVIQDARYLFDAAFHGARFLHDEHVGARYRVLEGSLSRRNPGQFWADVLVNNSQIEALWNGRDAVTDERLQAVRGNYNQAARGLFRAADERFFEAERALRRLGKPPLHPAIAGPLARVIGLKPARMALGLIGQS